MKIESLTLFGTVFSPTHTGVCWALEAISPKGERILITDNECEDLPTARDWMIGVYDDGENLVATHYSGGRMDQVQPFGTVDEVADLFAGVASIPVRVACTYGVSL